MSKILVTGPTGNVGQHVVSALVTQGRDVRAVVRDPGTASLPGRVEVVRGDLSSPETLTGDAAVPLSFGFHPYLRLPGVDRARWRVGLPMRRHLATDERGIPTGAATTEPAASFALGGSGFDDGYDEIGDGTRFSVAGPGRAMTVSLVQGYRAAQVFSPPGASFICFEPMTAPTNALRNGMGLRRVAPRETFTAVFRIDVA